MAGKFILYEHRNKLNGKRYILKWEYYTEG